MNATSKTDGGVSVLLVKFKRLGLRPRSDKHGSLVLAGHDRGLHKDRSRPPKEPAQMVSARCQAPESPDALRYRDRVRVGESLRAADQ